MRLAFREKPYDLYAVALLAIALVPFALLAVTGIARIALGLLFVLVLPGYALVAALFPKDGEIDWIERVALSFGLSIAVVPLIGLLLNFTPWGIRLEPVLATVLLFTLGIAAIAYWRRMGLPEDGRLGLAVEIGLPAWKKYIATDKALTVALAASIVFAAGTLAYVIATPRPGEHFTEFYILGPNGTASDYPNRLNEDLVRAFEAFVDRAPGLQGRVFNMGGGPSFTLSLLELVGLLEKDLGRKVPASFSDWRPADRKVYISDIRRAQTELSWAPGVGPAEGVGRILGWLKTHLMARSEGKLESQEH